MELNDIIATRHSVRAYQTRAIEPTKLETVLATATKAPSAGNRQSYRIHLVRSSVSRRQLATAALGQGFMAQAPLLLVFCADRAAAGPASKGNETRYSVQDAVIAAAYAQLAASEQGLATCWVGAFDEALVETCLKLPETQRPVVILTLGYANETPLATERRPLAEMVVDHGE